jgi:preprotein translocase subunit SecF
MMIFLLGTSSIYVAGFVLLLIGLHNNRNEPDQEEDEE